MNNLQAVEIIGKLAKGIHPFKGSKLPEKSVCQHPDSIQAFHKAIEALEHAQSPLERYGNGRTRARHPWKLEEEHDLECGFVSGISIPTLADNHGRTEDAIIMRLMKLGVLNES